MCPIICIGYCLLVLGFKAILCFVKSYCGEQLACTSEVFIGNTDLSAESIWEMLQEMHSEKILIHIKEKVQYQTISYRKVA